ncbi:CRISPR-associated endonuclease Cas3'' [Vibrio coralliirubri]|uniref:CRISPR-associated endonuclease Cas3'' n=1 Tax=Vibrio coralliirubri TaxID=1516159 RepID=UPI0022848613|nr:CRISPR-associated endonuclease Cas3'' [Vibrio coralliirubri]MCY9861514.1 CRISPR-associated endonuclease Cas3'' [Vibrio coralliirubri]
MIANTHFQSLSQHLFAVGYIASLIARKFATDEDVQNLQVAAFNAGCFHDLGKIDSQFQKWVSSAAARKSDKSDGEHIEKGKFSWDKHITHNEISILLFHLMDTAECKLLNGQTKLSVRHALLWHHAKKIRKKDFETIGSVLRALSDSNNGAILTDLYKSALTVMDDVQALSAEYGCKLRLIQRSDKVDLDSISALDEVMLPRFKSYGFNGSEIKEYKKEITNNARSNLVRMSVVLADRLVSSKTSEQLTSLIADKQLHGLFDGLFVDDGLELHTAISEYLLSFDNDGIKSERSINQGDVASDLAKYSDGHIVTLGGAAGGGKTKVALEWSQKTGAKQIIWVCPRVQVCQSVFAELTNSESLVNSVGVDIYTGDFKFTNNYATPTVCADEFKSGVVITTIDQISSLLMSNDKPLMLSRFLEAHVVVDEFHELCGTPALLVLFAELMQMKAWNSTAVNTLLVSATPNTVLLKELLGCRIVEVLDSHNASDFQLTLEATPDDEYYQESSVFKPQKAGERCFVITNTATAAQTGHLINLRDEQDSLLYHSKFTNSDKSALFDQICGRFGKDGSAVDGLVRSGPIIQASLNISCDRMISELSSPENCIQRLGRLDRFGLNASVNHYIATFPESMLVGAGSSLFARALKAIHSFRSAVAWLKFIQKIGLVGNPIPLNEVYFAYRAFYLSDEGVMAARLDLIDSLKAGANTLRDGFLEPKKQKSKPTSKDLKVLKKRTLRGNSRFVNMVVCNLDNPSAPDFTDKYLTTRDEEAAITYSLSEIYGSGHVDEMVRLDARLNERSLISKLTAKHVALKKVIIENAAISALEPIYLSYTSADLAKCGSHSAHEGSLFYVTTKSQPVGVMSLSNIQKIKTLTERD